MLHRVVASLLQLCVAFTALLSPVSAGQTGSVYARPRQRPPRFRPPPGATQDVRRLLLQSWRDAGAPRNLQNTRAASGGGSGAGSSSGGAGSSGTRNAARQRGAAHDDGDADRNLTYTEAGAPGHSSAGGRFGTLSPSRMSMSKDVRRYFANTANGADPLDEAVQFWWTTTQVHAFSHYVTLCTLQ